MAQDCPPATLRAGASCPLCLGLFLDPVSIHCGHSFCRGCIERRWEGSRGTFSCPQCQDTAPERSLRPNRELAEIIRIAQRLSLRAPRAGQEGQRLCQRHQEVLKLFCEEDQTPLCLRCRRCPEHRTHPAVPIEEAAEEHKDKLQTHVQTLKDRREKLQGLKTAEEGRSLELLDQVDTERQKVQSQVQELRQLLEGQERLLLARLEKLHQEILRRQEEKIRRFSEQICSVSAQIQELQEKCQQPPWELLQDSRDLLSRLEKESAQEAAETPPEPREQLTGLPQKNVALQELLRRFQVSLTLDPDTAHPRLVLSEDGKSVRWEETRRSVPDGPKRFDASRCVLGHQGFTSGRHFWQVEVGTGAAWAVGVAKESVGRKGRVRVNPTGGIWAVGQCGNQCQALTCPAVPLALPEPPKVIGVYLDYEEGRVAFFDPGKETPIFSYPPTSFGGEQVLPLLCLGRGCHVTLSP